MSEALPNEAKSPTAYAAAIARYISDPSTIRARTIDAWGRAPSVDACKALRATALEERDEFSRYWAARSTEQKDRHTPENYPCGHERSMENTWHNGDREKCRECFERQRGIIARRLSVRHMFEAPVVSEPTPVRPEETIPMTLAPSRRVLLMASKLFLLPVDVITSKSRDKRVVRARWAVIYTLRTVLGWTMLKSGQFVNISDHTTVRYTVREAAALIERDEWFAQVCARLADIATAERPKVEGVLVDALMRDAA